MNEVFVLNRQEIMDVLTLNDVIEAIIQAYKWKAEGQTETFPLIFHEFEHGVADMDIKSGHLKPAGIYGTKLVSFFLPNLKRKEAPLSATISLYDDTTGYLSAILEGSCITGMRTSAAAAIGAKYLARPESETLCVVGAGHQCLYQVAAMCVTMKQIKKVIICDPLNAENAKNKANNMKKLIQDELHLELPESLVITGEITLEEAIKESDIVVTITPSTKPLIQKEWVKPGTHFSCIGADMSGKQELDSAILKDAFIYTDDTPQCMSVGEIEMALKQGIIEDSSICGEIGEVICGNNKGRSHVEQITVFDSTGIAIQDLITAKKAVDLAKKYEKGQTIIL